MSESLKPVKLLHITTVPESLKFIKGQVGYMRSQGFEVHAVSSPGNLLVEFAEQEQVPVCAITMHRRITPFQDLYAIFQLWRHLQQIRPQLVHAHTPKGGLLGMMSAWLARVPIRVYHIRGLPLITATGFSRTLLQWSEKISCLLADHVFCVSHSIREVVLEEGLCPANKVQVLLRGSGNGVAAAGQFNPTNLDENIRQEIRRKYGIPSDALVIGFVGRIVRDKGVAELVTAWKTLKSQFPELHLLVVGDFEPRNAVTQDVKDALLNDSHIHLTGLDWNTPPLYAAMDIVVLPTYREGFPNVPLEAAAMRLPVVATRIPGCIDAVEDGVTGILVPPRDVDALTEAIQTYLTDSELRQQHGQAGRARVEKEFCQEAIWEAMYQEYVKFLHQKEIVVSHPLSSSKGTVLL